MATPEARLREFLPDARELAALFAARGIACVAAWHAGFRALSDDDYARISIAQRFAHAPRFDPSGTSWLPAPFWLYGAAFRGFGTGLGVARATAIGLGLGATVLVYVAARLLGASRFGAVLGAALSALLIPYSALLGIAALPEVPSAALCLFAAATLARREPALRALGGAALLGACLSRYEAWPIALVFTVFCAFDALRARRIALLAAAALAIVGPASWLILGRLAHGDALFFVARVTAYRRALGPEQGSAWQLLLEYPRLLLWDAPALCGMLLVLRLYSRRLLGRQKLDSSRCAFALLALLLFLMFGSISDGVPTHHAARVLLPIWFFGCVLGGHGAAQFATDSASRLRIAVVIALMAAVPAFFGLGSRAEGFAQRAPEIEAGRAARQSTSEALTIDTPDYGYFAVQAGFGSPSGSSVLDEHDPRHPQQSPFSTAQSLDRELRRRGARFVIVTAEHAALLDARCSKFWQSPRFVLAECSPSAPAAAGAP